MKIEHSRCLVLNGDYSPLGIIDWKKAITWSIKYNHDNKHSVEILDFYKNDHIVCVNKNIPIPAVVKTTRYFKLNNQSVNFSRKNLFIRDDYTCQYCGLQTDIRQLTYDHVIPKSLWNSTNGSPTCWTNIVTACITCNRKKANRTPSQAKMPLKNNPFVPRKSPKYLPVAGLLFMIRSDIPVEWHIYLPESYLLR